MEDNKFRFILLTVAAVIIIPVLNAVYGIIPALITAVLVIAAIVFLIVMLKKHPAKKTIEETELSSDITSIMIEAKGRNYVLAPGSGFLLEDSAQGPMMTFVEDGVWHIADNGDRLNTPVEVTVPADFAPKELTMIVTGGNIVSSIQSADRAHIDVHTGSADVRGLRTDSLQASVGSGALCFEGAAAVDVKLLCGMGTLDARLRNSEDYFNIEASCGLGSLVVGSESFGSERRVGSIDNGSNYSMEVSVGMGSAKISFGEEQEV